MLDEDKSDYAFADFRDLLIFMMFYETGMRRSELINLQDSDIDFDGVFIRVVGKRNKERLIPFGEELRLLMKKYLEMRNELYQQARTYFFLPIKVNKCTRNLFIVL